MDKPFCSNLQDRVSVARAPIALCLSILIGCAPALPSPTPTSAPQPTLAPTVTVATLAPTRQPAATTLPTSAPPPTVARRVSYVRGSSQKICQLTGDTDRERNQPTLNQTFTRFGVTGTDEGVPFEHDGKVFFLFGDSPGRAKFKGADSIAFSTDTNPEDCIALDFVAGPDRNFLSPTVPGINHGGYDIPNGGISVNGRMYVFFTTDHQEDPANNLGRTILARSDNNAQSFSMRYEASRMKFINLVLASVNNVDVLGLPQNQGQGILIWGTGPYRKSSPFLAYVPASAIEDRKAWRFFSGLQAGAPRWSEDEAAAAPLFEHPCIGEISVTWNQFLNKWLMLYNCAEPRGINFRVADRPWGPWSPNQILFHLFEDNGYCHFIHASYSQRNCDAVHDRGRENEAGAAYGPYVISRFTTGSANQTTIYFVLSTWNPYQVVLMKSTLRLE